MRINLSCRRISSYTTWEKWYAWRPVFVGRHLVWLEYVERKWDGSCYDPDFHYRLHKGD
jgi:hypothetical protein